MGNAIRYANPTAPANYAEGADTMDRAYCRNVAKGTYLEMHSVATVRENKAMSDALAEGTLGRAWQAFRTENPSGAMRVIESAMVFWVCSKYNPSYRAKRNISDMPGDLTGIGAYAHSFTEIVAEMAAPNIPDMLNHFGHVAWQRDAWDWFAANVAAPRRTRI